MLNLLYFQVFCPMTRMPKVPYPCPFMPQKTNSAKREPSGGKMITLVSVHFKKGDIRCFFVDGLVVFVLQKKKKLIKYTKKFPYRQLYWSLKNSDIVRKSLWKQKEILQGMYCSYCIVTFNKLLQFSVTLSTFFQWHVSR